MKFITVVRLPRTYLSGNNDNISNYTYNGAFLSLLCNRRNSGLTAPPMLNCLDHTQLDTHTSGWTPLNERPDRLRWRYTAQNKHIYRSVGFEPTLSAFKRLLHHSLDSKGTKIITFTAHPTMDSGLPFRTRL